ncbi:VOC family protein [Galbibacter sp. EGI 63066]|uniref:VOC family protein n=1 Tax=Galbibacter sp. EGI 63066 TaxID=2993559 RepID=UPI00224999CC|nr:VOC family protein [Galbibacter sp. EGI 63066]MCX2681568.1 VOC family protein [Galbibacter sp. EGI 63066]
MKAQQIFVNLAVNDLKKSMTFFETLGFTFNKKISDETASCLVLGENLHSMLLTKDKFKEFTKKPLSNAKQQTETLVALQLDNKEEVDNIVKKAVDAGGSIYAEPQDYGFMYQHSFEDLDGHQWEVFFMDESKFPS